MARPRKLAPHPCLSEHVVEIPELDPRHEGLRIAHLSDVHVGRLTPPEHVRAAVALANQAAADVIVMTGDYVCWSRHEVAAMGDQLAGLEARRVVATLGNHDYFTSSRRVIEALGENGYDVLRNQHLTVDVGGAPLELVGIDDPVTRHHDLDQAFARLPERGPGTRVALCHCPEQADELVARGAALVLAGHTHGGQIFLPGITDRLIEKMGRRYRSGFYPVGGRALYVTAGVGFSGIRVRTGDGTRAEVGVLTLRRPLLAAA